MGPVTRVLSSERISSGYMTDQYLPVDSETLDTGDYELWDRSQQLTGRRDWARPPHREVGASSHYIACMA